jgi:argininosuccinate synthase
MTVSPERAKDEAEYVEIEFAKGEPVVINGDAWLPVALLENLNELGGAHGIGRVDLGREPFRRHEVARRLRNSGCDDLAGRSSRLESITMDR